jgi:hypothetical protein
MRMREIITLFESTSAGDLYHGTSVVNAAYIIKENEMRADDSHDDDFGVSFSRDSKIAWQFSAMAEDRGLDWLSINDGLKPNTDELPGQPSGRGAMLIFDGDKMRSHFPNLQHYAWDDVKDEQEERMHGEDGFINISDYLKTVIVSSEDCRWWAMASTKAPETFMNSIEGLMTVLARHPLRRDP